MNLTTFLHHHGLASNPFAAEEARQDDVFVRLEESGGGDFRHPDFDKIAGELARPGSAVVFGERGTGKTAIRIQLARRLEAHNRVERTHRVMSVVHDDFDGMLRAIARRTGGDPVSALRKVTLADHMDAILATAVPVLVDRVLDPRSGDGAPPGAVQLVLDDDGRRRARGLDPRVRDGMMVLQACYDRPEGAAARTAKLRRRLRLGGGSALMSLPWLASLLALCAIAAVVVARTLGPWRDQRTLLDSGAAALGVIALVAAVCWLWRFTQRAALARALRRSLRLSARPVASLRATLGALPRLGELASWLPGSRRPTARRGAATEGEPSQSGADEEARFAMFARLLDVLRGLGHAGIVVMVDRVDEPVAVAGDVERMRTLVWPLLSSRFLQQDGVGVKLLLPLDLRPYVMRESSEFFRGARLDKQNFVDRLSWSGATLYDLCTARINACRAPGTEPVSLMGFFDSSVRQQDVVDALDQLQQPRDAMKFLYAVLQELCTATPDESPQWQVPKALFDLVRKRQVERMQEMLKGVRPA